MFLRSTRDVESTWGPEEEPCPVFDSSNDCVSTGSLVIFGETCARWGLRTSEGGFAFEDDGQNSTTQFQSLVTHLNNFMVP